MPVSNKTYWSAKIQKNRMRDMVVAAKLRSGGWRVLRIWEHELKNPDCVVKRLRVALGYSFSEISASSPCSSLRPAFEVSSNRSRASFSRRRA